MVDKKNGWEVIPYYNFFIGKRMYLENHCSKKEIKYNDDYVGNSREDKKATLPSSKPSHGCDQTHTTPHHIYKSIRQRRQRSQKSQIEEDKRRLAEVDVQIETNSSSQDFFKPSDDFYEQYYIPYYSNSYDFYEQY